MRKSKKRTITMKNKGVTLDMLILQINIQKELEKLTKNC